MKERTQRPRLKQAFTLIELLVVIGIICLLASFMLPALARAKIKSPAAGCLSNLRQLQLGCSMYKDDYNDNLVPNMHPGAGTSWLPSTLPNENWGNSQSNTNAALYTNSFFWPYLAGNINVFRCPGDVIPSDNGYRIRTYSMNGQMGQTSANPNLVFRVYKKGADLVCPTPANAFAFCDETFWTVNDGWLEIDASTPDFPDAPAAYMGGGCGFGFADGHAEVHKWTGPYSFETDYPVGLRGVAYQYGIVRPGSAHVGSSGSDPDWVWLTQHATCKIN